MKNIKTLGFTKGILLVIAGLLIAFFPGIISGLFYMIGGIIVAFCLIRLIINLMAGGGMPFTAGDIMGIIAGIVIMFLPSLVKTSIPLIAGIVFASAGTERIFDSISIKKYGGNFILKLVLGIVLICFGAFLILHPFKTGDFIRIVIGAIMIGIGVFNIVIDSKTADSRPDIIDVTDYTVTDDKKYLK